MKSSNWRELDTYAAVVLTAVVIGSTFVLIRQAQANVPTFVAAPVVVDAPERVVVNGEAYQPCRPGPVDGYAGDQTFPCAEVTQAPTGRLAVIVTRAEEGCPPDTAGALCVLEWTTGKGD